ncbi:NAD-dependent epimerase/dehydratase family protein [Chryseosolibacter indicus]|uniref:NAD-dependent epimerase/dehydratase family protein n=1 Tax=Chryseosolibacter indicus TaxID=2782351 RepID=A0ABS5VWE2_9BACT|nr:NAD-dependent epimerase/dehydratase family protein [Chryseosolibacter indicus]MBT1705738.1 NAD-dependent epimerase/dehydratase family protein [Chryseosolibacter indicus]
MIAVTGANGLLGSFIVRQLVYTKQPFIAIKRKDSDIHLLYDITQHITWREADILDPVSFEEALQGVTQVIHCAAMVSFNPAHERKIMDINVIGTRNTINASLANNVKRFVYISSVAALGRQKDQSFIDETNKWIDSPQNTVYAKSKYYAELEVFRGNEEGLNTVILNPSVILAAADWNKSSGQIFKYVWDERSFYIDSYLNYVDVRDVADIAVKLLNHSASNERFIVSAGNISIVELFSSIARRFNKKQPTIKLNRNLVQFAAFTENIRAKLSGSEPLITKETARLAGTRFAYNNNKITRLLDFSFKPIDDSVSWCCDYYLKHHDKK